MSLQILAHMPLANIQLPSNALDLFEIMFIVVSFDFFPVSDIIDFGFSPTDPWTENFASLGYESINFIEGMGSIILFIWVGFLFVWIVAILALFKVRTNTLRCGKKCKVIFTA